MLEQKFRIRNKNRVSYVLKKGSIRRADFFQLRYLSSRTGHNTFAVLVSKKVSPRATDRNLLKRRVTEALRTQWKELPPTCYDIVILMSPRALKISYEALAEALLLSLKKL